MAAGIGGGGRARSFWRAVAPAVTVTVTACGGGGAGEADAGTPQQAPTTAAAEPAGAETGLRLGPGGRTPDELCGLLATTDVAGALAEPLEHFEVADGVAEGGGTEAWCQWQTSEGIELFMLAEFEILSGGDQACRDGDFGGAATTPVPGLGDGAHWELEGLGQLLVCDAATLWSFSLEYLDADEEPVRLGVEALAGVVLERS
jgi:hypothetical protein